MAIAGSWGRFGCEASPPRESHTHHPASSSLGNPRVAGRMGDHPVFRYPVFRERCSPSGFGLVGLSVGGAGFLVQPRLFVKRFFFRLFEGPHCLRNYPGGAAVGILGSETTASFVAVDLRRPLLPTRCPSSSAGSSELVAGDGMRTLRIHGPVARVFGSKVQKCVRRVNSGGLEAVWKGPKRAPLALR